jgi:hypothetical protein
MGSDFAWIGEKTFKITSNNAKRVISLKIELTSYRRFNYFLLSFFNYFIVVLIIS